MTSEPFILAVIPARGGSKRIKRKNIAPFAGKPMIEWPATVLKNCESISDILISTDDEEILEFAKNLDVKAPFKRPAELSDDYATTIDVISHALGWYEINVRHVDLILTIYPTAVFINNEIIRDAISLQNRSQANTIFPVIEYPYPIQRGLFLGNENQVEMIDPNQHSTRSQDLKPAYHDAGQFYLQTPDAIKSGLPILSNNSRALIIDRLSAVDIDTPQDFKLAENIFLQNR